MKDYITQFADELYQAEVERTVIEPLTSRNGKITIQDAYDIQLRNVERKISLGWKVKGKKIGLTSRAIQETFGVNQPDFGHLFDKMYVEDGGVVSLETLIQPRVEGEIAFVLESDLEGPGVTEADVLRATAFVLPSIEIIDSRIKDWKIKIQDTIADNASSGLFVLGSVKQSPVGLDLRCLGMVLELNGDVVVSGAGAASLGNPVKAVAWVPVAGSQLPVMVAVSEKLSRSSPGAKPLVKAMVAEASWALSTSLTTRLPVSSVAGSFSV